jgi:hypothetical protein
VPESTEDERRCPGRGCDAALRRDEFLCRPCVRAAVRALDRLPALLAELETTIARQSRGAGSSGHAAPGSRLPINLTALAKRNHEQIIVAFACELGYQPTTFDLPGVVTAVTEDPTKLRTRLDGPEFARAIHTAASEWRNVVDPGSEMVFAGRCTVCLAALRTTRDSLTTRCRSCGTEYDTTVLLAHVDQRVHDAVLPVGEVRDVVAKRVGLRVAAATVRKWRQRMKLSTWCLVEDRTEVCRVGDYLDLAKALHPSPTDQDATP